MTRLFVAFLVGCQILGCSKPAEPPVGSSSATSTPPAVGGINAEAETIHGTGGPIRLGDSITVAKKNAPAPKGSQVFDTSLSFAILGVDGWAWASSENESFEVAIEGGKVIAIARTFLDQKNALPLDDHKRDYGPPSRIAKDSSVSMAVWDSGDNARIVILFTGAGMFGTGSITMVGPKAKLKLLNYDANDPQTFVTQYESATKALDKQAK